MIDKKEVLHEVVSHLSKVRVYQKIYIIMLIKLSEGVGVSVGVKGSIAETTETFTKMLTLGLVII